MKLWAMSFHARGVHEINTNPFVRRRRRCLILVLARGGGRGSCRVGVTSRAVADRRHDARPCWACHLTPRTHVEWNAHASHPPTSPYHEDGPLIWAPLSSPGPSKVNGHLGQPNFYATIRNRLVPSPPVCDSPVSRQDYTLVRRRPQPACFRGN